MTNPNWKPQPGKPAMTRDEKTLVTDLEFVKHFKKPLYSPSRAEDWYLDGKYLGPKGTFHYDLIEPTAAILAAHGIDADGKPVADHDIRQAGGFLRTKICDVCGATDATGDDRLGKSCPGKPVAKVTCEDCGGTGLVLNTIGEPDECRECHGNTVVDAPGACSDGGKSLEPDAPAPFTRVDDRWFEAAKDFTGAIIINEGTNNHDQSFDVKRAARYADALMAEVAKREGR